MRVSELKNKGCYLWDTLLQELISKDLSFDAAKETIVTYIKASGEQTYSESLLQLLGEMTQSNLDAMLSEAKQILKQAKDDNSTYGVKVAQTVVNLILESQLFII